MWLDAARAKWENVFYEFGWTDPLILYSLFPLFPGVWLEIPAVKATATWLSLSSTTFRPTSSVRYSRRSFDMSVHTDANIYCMFIMLHYAFVMLYVRFEFHRMGRGVDAIRLWAAVWWRSSGSIVWVGELQPRSRATEHHHDAPSSHSASVRLPHEVTGQLLWLSFNEWECFSVCVCPLSTMTAHKTWGSAHQHLYCLKTLKAAAWNRWDMKVFNWHCIQDRLQVTVWTFL